MMRTAKEETKQIHDEAGTLEVTDRLELEVSDQRSKLTDSETSKTTFKSAACPITSFPSSNLPLP